MSNFFAIAIIQEQYFDVAAVLELHDSLYSDLISISTSVTCFTLTFLGVEYRVHLVLVHVHPRVSTKFWGLNLEDKL